MEEIIIRILISLCCLVMGWYLGYIFKELIEPILLKRRDERLKKKLLKQKQNKKEELTWTSSWTPYKTTITIECVVNDSIDEYAKCILIKHLRERLEGVGIRVTVDDEDIGDKKDDKVRFLCVFNP